jgi:hypothetical protein
VLARRSANHACRHSARVHLRGGTGRCAVVGCGCLFGPGPIDFEKPQPTPAQRILRESDTRKLERRLWHAIELAGLPLPDQLEYRWAGRR